MVHYFSAIEFAVEARFRATAANKKFEVVTPASIDDIDVLSPLHKKKMRLIKEGETLVFHQVYLSDIAEFLGYKLPFVNVDECIRAFTNNSIDTFRNRYKRFDNDELSVDFLCMKKENGKIKFSVIEGNGSGHEVTPENIQQVAQDSVKHYFLTMLNIPKFIAPSGILKSDEISVQVMIDALIDSVIR